MRNNHEVKGQIAFWLWTLLLLALISTGFIFLERAENKRYIDNQRRSVVEQLSTIRAKLEGDLNGELLLTRSIVTEIAIDTDISQERFNRIAEHFWKSTKHIRNIALAKGAVNEYVYPIEGNEKALGLDYTTAPDQWPAVRRVLEERVTVIAGPLLLVQGDMAIIGRMPILVDDPATGSTEVYGLLSVVMNIPSLLTAAGAGDNEVALDIAIRGKDGLGEDGDIFFGDEDIFNRDPILMNVSLPEGSWRMAATPAGGWTTTSPLALYYRLATALTILIIFLLLVFERIEVRKRKRVEMQKEELIRKLQKALSEVKQLSGLLPICSVCKKVRDDMGYWSQIETYLSKHSDVSFTHSICKECAAKLYPELSEDDVE